MTQQILASAPDARRLVGRVVPLHQGRRRRRLLTRGPDGGPHADRRCRALRATSWRRSGRGPRCCACARPGGRRSRSASSTPPLPFWLDRLGRAAHRLRAQRESPRRRFPIFSLLIGLRFLPHERIGAARDRRRRPRASSALPSSRAARPEGGALAVVGTLAVVLASVFYASAGIYSQLHLEARSRARCWRPARCSPAA